MSSLAKLLEQINNEQEFVGCYVPSLDESTNFKPLTLASQKEIISVTVDSAIGILKFHNAIFSIIKQSAPVGVAVDSFTTIDRVALSIALRAQLNDVYKHNDVEYSLTSILKGYGPIPTKVKDGLIVRSGNYKFTLGLPTLQLEENINNALIARYSESKLDGPEKVKQLISNIYVYEILKFVKDFEVNGVQYNLHQDIKGGASLIEKISSKHLTNVTQFIHQVRDVEASYATLPGTATTVDITPEFFIV